MTSVLSESRETLFGELLPPSNSSKHKMQQLKNEAEHEHRRLAHMCAGEV